MDKQTFSVVSFYKFVSLKDLDHLQATLLPACKKHNIQGTIILSEEGINGKLSALRSDMEAIQSVFGSIDAFSDIHYQTTYADFSPFDKLKFKRRKEIVALKVDGLDMSERGEKLGSREWNKLLDEGECLLIDTRNAYEISFGTFPNSINPNTHYFWEMVNWMRDNLKDLPKNKKIAMFCTEEIRCEKTTAFVKQLGFQNVYQLEGGIMKYLLDTQGESNLWQGDLFVFDNRVAVDKQAAPVQ